MGLSLKRCKYYSNLNKCIQESNGLINEDDLMETSTVQQAVGKFCSDNDVIKPGKACENCTCGRKELEEGNITEKDLETGNV